MALVKYDNPKSNYYDDSIFEFTDVYAIEYPGERDIDEGTVTNVLVFMGSGAFVLLI